MRSRVRRDRKEIALSNLAHNPDPKTLQRMKGGRRRRSHAWKKTPKAFSLSFWVCAYGVTNGWMVQFCRGRQTVTCTTQFLSWFSHTVVQLGHVAVHLMKLQPITASDWMIDGCALLFWIWLAALILWNWHLCVTSLFKVWTAAATVALSIHQLVVTCVCEDSQSSRWSCQKV